MKEQIQKSSMTPKGSSVECVGVGGFHHAMRLFFDRCNVPLKTDA